MALKQTRRIISVSGVTYDAVRADCADQSISLSDYVERLIFADRARRGLAPIVHPKRDGRGELVPKALPSPDVSRVVAAVKRQGHREVVAAARALAERKPFVPFIPGSGQHMAAKAEVRRAPAGFGGGNKPLSPPRSTSSLPPRPPHSSDRVPPPKPDRGPRNVLEL